MAELQSLLGHGSHDGEETVKIDIRQHRTGCLSKLEDAASDMRAAMFRAKTQVLSHPTVVALLLFSSRVSFIYDFVSDGLVAGALFAGGHIIWGRCVIVFMVLPYVVMVVTLFDTATRRLAQLTKRPQYMTGTAWLFGGPLACLVADVYLNIRYAGCDPLSVEVFHYMTLRDMAEFVEAQTQLILQSYIGLRQLNPRQLFPPVAGTQPVNPLLLASSVGTSLYTAYSISSKLRNVANNQSGGSIRRLQRHRRVVITYNLVGIDFRELERLSVVAKRAQQLEELVFQDGEWVADLTARGRSKRVVMNFASAPNLTLLEVQAQMPIPSWAIDGISEVAKSHRCLKFAYIQGSLPIVGAYVQGLHEAHPLLQAAERGDRTEISHLGRAPLSIHADALALAASRNSIELLRTLLLHDGLEAVNMSGGSNRGLDSVRDDAKPLHFAAAFGSHRAVNLLLVARGEVDSVDTKGFTPLHKAAQADSVRTINALLGCGAEINTCAKSGETALWLAAREGNSSSVKCLITAKADTDKVEKHGTTPLHVAAQSNAAKCLQILLQAKGDINKASKTKVTPLYSAAEHNSAESLKMLLCYRADVHAANCERFTPMGIAALNNNAECLRLLIKSRADIQQAMEGGTSPLYIAAETDSFECLQLLLRNRAEVNRKCHNGMTPLLVAAQRGNTDCLRPLLLARADLHVKWRGMSAMDWARHESHMEVVAALEC